MDLQTAALMVAMDQRKNDFRDITTDRARVEYAREVMVLPGEHPSNWAIEDDGSEMSNAYIAVLKATDAEIAALSL